MKPELTPPLSAPVSVPGTALPAPQAAALRVILDCSLLSTSTSHPSANPGSSSFKIFPEPSFALSSLAPPWACPLISPIWRVAAVCRPSSCSLSPAQSQRDPVDTCVGSHPSLLRALPWIRLTQGNGQAVTMVHGAPRDLPPTFLFNQPLPCRALATPQPALLFSSSDLFPAQASALARPLPGYSSLDLV